MKGIVFTTFIEMVEQKFSLKTLDTIITNAHLPSGGSYTTLGTYDHSEMIQLVVKLSEQTGIPVADLVRVFGEYLFVQLVDMYPQFVDSNRTLFGFLLKIDSYIHVEVLKLYPDAELPRFEYDTSDPEALVMIYRSSRPFADLAEGLILGSIQHYGEAVDLKREDISDGPVNAARFTLTKRG
ncbi:Haem-NO-binding [Paenibacillus sp. 1_12]|uniref:heme NO-binding domain-containing protein n=1 Tax=Paenibacillus sp. 1_12 TaxID=1566278 RepID=UPI0008EC815F|nr:heme NO-binding domain-containing protein [Paenibacillus sp. 1_12]SFK67618.1 Haem-NO-binding [Paenibacillus sp. 1_12]